MIPNDLKSRNQLYEKLIKEIEMGGGGNYQRIGKTLYG
jgi:hypothetical protein